MKNFIIENLETILTVISVLIIFTVYHYITVYQNNQLWRQEVKQAQVDKKERKKPFYFWYDIDQDYEQQINDQND